MKRLLSKGVLLVLMLVAVAGWQPATVGAEHDNFRFKWPYLPGASYVVTGYPYTAHHGCPPGPGQSCTDAWDIVIADSQVRASAEGLIVDARNSINPISCNSWEGLGNFVKMLTATPNGDIVVSYGHFESTPFNEDSVGLRLLQGDPVGVQGYTGHTEGDTPPPCGTHLHFEFVPAHPDKIDNTTNPSESTNSYVGEYNAPGDAIQDRYWDFGELGLGPSWSVAGWTADWTDGQGACPSNPFCQLYVHYAPDPEVGHWGSVQTFRKHPGTPVTDDNSIMVGRWDVNTAYWVEEPFFAAWLGGLQRIGLPVIDRVGSGAICGPVECCPVSVGCERYQRFHVGYIWEDETLGVQDAVFCPDVSPYYPNQDYAVNINDIFAVAGAFGQVDSSAPFQPWAGAWHDIDGNGVININEIFLVAGSFPSICVP